MTVSGHSTVTLCVCVVTVRATLAYKSRQLLTHTQTSKLRCFYLVHDGLADAINGFVSNVSGTNGGGSTNDGGQVHGDLDTGGQT